MAGGVVAEAALGAAFENLFKSIAKATQGAALFSSNLIRLQASLCLIKLTMDDIESFNRILEPPTHEKEAFTTRLIEGEKLIKKCSKVKCWDPFSRWYYSKKLTSFEAQLLKFFQINVAAFHFRETKSISVDVSSLKQKVAELAMKRNKNADLEEKMDEIARSMLKLTHEIGQISAAAKETNVSLIE